MTKMMVLMWQHSTFNIQQFAIVYLLLFLLNLSPFLLILVVVVVEVIALVVVIIIADGDDMSWPIKRQPPRTVSVRELSETIRRYQCYRPIMLIEQSELNCPKNTLVSRSCRSAR